MLIGLSGYARSGKDSVANVLVEDDGLMQVAFADKVREAALAINPFVMPTLRLRELVAARGWEGAKTYPEVRELLQRIGEGMRKLFGEDVWINALARSLDLDAHSYAISDVRYRNEAAWIMANGGEIWRIRRPGVGPANDHMSEHDLDTWIFDRCLDNDDSLHDLRDKVHEALHQLNGLQLRSRTATG